MKKRGLPFIFICIIVLILLLKIVYGFSLVDYFFSTEGKSIKMLFIVLSGAFIALLLSAEFMGRCAEKIGAHLGKTIGILLIAISSSLPELVISIISSLQGNPNIAVANILGSNIANITLILGIVCIFRPIKPDKGFLKGFLVLLAVIATSMFIFYTFNFPFSFAPNNISNNFLTRSEALVMIIIFIIYFIFEHLMGTGEESAKEGNLLLNIALVFVTGIILWTSAELTITTLVEIASHYGIPETLIAVTLMAVGTSLPELTISIVSSVKGNDSLIFGNLVGSNAFDITVCLAAAVLILPFAVGLEMITFHLPMVILVNLVVIGMAIKGEFNRTMGFILIGMYALYVFLIKYSPNLLSLVGLA